MNLLINVADGLVVNSEVITRHLNEELPFMASENILMNAVKAGGNRQKLHEKLRNHSMAAADKLKKEGGRNDLIERVTADPDFCMDEETVREIMKPENYTGLACHQVEQYLRNTVYPVMDKYEESSEESVTVEV